MYYFNWLVLEITRFATSLPLSSRILQTFSGLLRSSNQFILLLTMSNSGFLASLKSVQSNRRCVLSPTPLLHNSVGQGSFG